MLLRALSANILCISSEHKKANKWLSCIGIKRWLKEGQEYVFGCWNMTMLVKEGGPVTRKSGRAVAVDKICVRWMGIRSYILGSQCQVLLERNEGVGIVIDTDMACLCRSSGRVWNAVSSGVVSIRLKLDNQAARPLYHRGTYI